MNRPVRSDPQYIRRVLDSRKLRTTLIWTFVSSSLTCGLVFVWSAVGSAQENPNRVIVITSAAGREYAGTLIGIERGQLSIAAPDPQKLPTRNLIHLKFKNRQVQQTSAEPVVVLADGSCLTARAVASDDESLTVRWGKYPAWDPLKLPLDAVRGIIFSRPDTPAADARLWSQIAEHRERHDFVLLRNGDTLIGQFIGLDERSVTLETSAGKSSIDRGGLQALIFNPELMNVERLKGEGALVSLIDGSRFRVHGLKLGSGSLDRMECRTAFGTRLDLPVLTIDSLRFLGGCATYLSELDPAQYRFVPYFDFEWSLRRDRNVLGGPLTLRGVEYPRGLGVHSQCEVSYRLDGKFRRFQATIGIDDATRGKGSAVFEVVLDGKSLYKSNDLTGAAPAEIVDRIDVTGGRMLTLRVEYGAMADIQDYADWCDALLVK